jgi:hypothetical protein
MRARAALGACAFGLATGSAAAADPGDASLAWRRDCEALTALGRRSEAVLACSRALETVRSGDNVRALVSALVDGPTPPTSAELALALAVTATERDKGGAVTSAAATCDIAERIGDLPMLQRCADELRRIAPDDPATGKAESALSAACPPWRFWGGWSLVAVALAATLGHAGRRSLARRRAMVARLPAAAALSAALLAPAVTARADEPEPQRRTGLSRWPVDDAHPESSIPSDKDRDADPLQFGYWLQDVSWKAEIASKRDDHAAAARYYRALGLAVHDRAVAFVKACEEYEALGDRDQAIEMCGQALLRDGLTVKDYDHFVHLVLGQTRPLTDKETFALAQVLDHMREDPAGRDVVDDLECQVGARTSNVAQLRECTAALAARSPDDPRTISYLWALAVAEDDGSGAEVLVERARTAGVAPQDVERMSHTTQTSVWHRRVRTVLVVVAFCLLAAAMAVAGRAVAARRRKLTV